LPLLLDIRCFDPTALGLNALDCSLTVNPALGVFQGPPNFRIYSSGGEGASGPVIKDPSLQTSPTGGFNENPTLGPVGSPIPGFDDVFYMGQTSFVVRVSRVHTIWFDTTNADPNYAEPFVVPDPSEQPGGTSVVLAFRGGNSATGNGADNANCLDAYGDIPGASSSCFLSTLGPPPTPPVYGPAASKNGGITAVSPWRSSVDEIDNSQVFQVRITFLNNTATSLSPELSALGIAFVKS
jgi:hypothetical protein